MSDRKVLPNGSVEIRYSFVQTFLEHLNFAREQVDNATEDLRRVDRAALGVAAPEAMAYGLFGIDQALVAVHVAQEQLRLLAQRLVEARSLMAPNETPRSIAIVKFGERVRAAQALEKK